MWTKECVTEEVKVVAGATAAAAGPVVLRGRACAAEDKGRGEALVAGVVGETAVATAGGHRRGAGGGTDSRLQAGAGVMTSAACVG